MRTNKIFELNRTGARLWELLEQGEDLARIKAQLLTDFDVEEEKVARELEAIVSQLIADNLVIERDRD